MILSFKVLGVFATKSESGGRRSKGLARLAANPRVKIEGLEASLKRLRSGVISPYHDPHDLFD